MSSYRGRFKHLADPLDWMALHLIGEGNRAGELARECFPGGSHIGHIYDLDRARAETAAAMATETATHIFEGAFACDARIVDLLPIVREFCYHLDFHLLARGERCGAGVCDA